MITKTPKAVNGPKVSGVTIVATESGRRGRRKEYMSCMPTRKETAVVLDTSIVVGYKFASSLLRQSLLYDLILSHMTWPMHFMANAGDRDVSSSLHVIAKSSFIKLRLSKSDFLHWP